MQRFFGSDFPSKIFGKYRLFRVFIGRICGIIPRFLLGGAGVDETKSKIVILKIIGYFRDICHKVFLNNACFAADVVGFLIHILGLRIFPKSFGFFRGYSQQDLLVGRSP